MAPEPFPHAFGVAQLRRMPQWQIAQERMQVLSEMGRALVALRRVRREALAHDALECPGRVGPMAAQRRRVLAALDGQCLELGRQQYVTAALVEGRAAGEHLEEDHAERVNV